MVMTFEEFDEIMKKNFPDGAMIVNERYPKFWRLPDGVETHEMRFKNHTYFGGKRKPVVMINRILKVGDKTYILDGAVIVALIETREELELRLDVFHSPEFEVYTEEMLAEEPV